MTKLRLGKKIKALREEKRLSQAALAKFMACTPSTICNWETGDCYPSVTQVLALQVFFGVSLLDPPTAAPTVATEACQVCGREVVKE